MDCKKIEEIILTDYIDGKLDGRQLNDLEAHLASCNKCRAFASGAKEISADLRKSGRMLPPAEVWERIRAEITAEPAIAVSGQNIFETIRLFLARPRPVLMAATAAVFVLAALLTARIMLFGGPTNPEDEIFSMVDLSENSNGSDYNLGTPAENYFL